MSGWQGHPHEYAYLDSTSQASNVTGTDTIFLVSVGPRPIRSTGRQLHLMAFHAGAGVISGPVSSIQHDRIQ